MAAACNQQILRAKRKPGIDAQGPAAPGIQSHTQTHRPSEHRREAACAVIPTQLEPQQAATRTPHTQEWQQSGRLALSASARPGQLLNIRPILDNMVHCLQTP